MAFEEADGRYGSILRSHRKPDETSMQNLEGYGVDIVPLIIGRGPPDAMGLTRRHGWARRPRVSGVRRRPGRADTCRAGKFDQADTSLNELTDLTCRTERAQPPRSQRVST